jgi:hypothetical protein
MDIDSMRVNAGDIVEEIIAYQILDAIFDDPPALILGENSAGIQIRGEPGRPSVTQGRTGTSFSNSISCNPRLFIPLTLI